MKTATTRGTLARCAAAMSLGVACGGGTRSGEDAESATSGMTSVSDTQGGVTADPGTTGATSGTSDDPTTGDSGPGDPVCETQQCGDACCEQGQECVLGQCRAACAAGVRCGDDLTTCCGADQVCLQPDCITPGQDCVDSFDCPIGEFCEPILGACIPQLDPVACEVLPDFEDVQLQLEWSHELQQIEVVPLVGDVDGDDLPEVVITTFSHDDDGDGEEGIEYTAGIVMVFAGESGQMQRGFPIYENPPASFGAYGYATAGLSDVNGNGLPDIVYAGRADGAAQSLVHAVDGLGTRLWTSHGNSGAPYRLYVRNAAPSFANFDDDDAAEVVFGGAILDDNGLVVWDGGVTHPTLGPLGGGAGMGPLIGSNPNADNVLRGLGGVTAIADVAGDDTPELITGRHAFSVQWVQPAFGNPQVTVSLLWDAGVVNGEPDMPDGWPAIGDLDQNGTPEVVLVADGTVRVLDAATGALWCGVDPTGTACAGNDSARTQPITIPDTGAFVGRGGPPTIADFDGDGRPEASTAAAEVYVVLDFHRAGEQVVQPAGDPPPAAGDIFVRWSAPTRDRSSNGTGSSVFDFQGDGRAEVMYGDECYFRIYDGSTGTPILEIENSSVTAREYPVVADVDGDGNSELLVVANDNSAGAHCADIDGYQGRRGLFVYGDPNGQWVRTRRVWNQHAYHVTNADSRGNAPAVETDSWAQPSGGTYRQNVQGAGVFNAPDLTVDLAVGLSTCLDEEFEILATVRNTGSLGVPAGIEVALHEGNDGTGTLIGPSLTTMPLLPGSFELVSWTVPAPVGAPKTFYVAVDGAASASGVVTECDETNNDASTVTVACETPG